ncbi:hypothetical protein AYO22_01702 [Fonsecaea multimorphosa]|nr:hypothetical protein AYO22_01702 [Fonsecaea multimorphosa]
MNEDLPPRQLLMEQLVGRLFPEVAVADVNELAKLADCLETSRVQLQFVRDKILLTTNGSIVQCDLVSSTSRPILEDRLSCVSPSERGRFATTPLGLSSIPAPSPSSSPATTSSPRGNCSERILQNSSGTLCYFGPSSSMAFVTQLREHLISTAIQNSEKLQPKQRRLRQRFVADNYCCTMEEPSAARNTQASTQHRSDSLQSVPEDMDDVSVDAYALTSPMPDGPQRLVDLLPAREEVEHLVELFFVHIHPNMTLFHRPLFQSALERLWTSDRESSLDVGWLTCCLLVLAFGCKYLESTSTDETTSGPPRNTRNLQQRFVEIALGNVARLIQCATLQSVQALALLSLYLNTTHQRNASWIMMGCSIRMAIGLGMHRSDKVLLQQQKSVLSTAVVDRELRKRVWWSLYVFEQYNSALFGRPSAIDEQETTADLPTDSILDGGYHRPPGLVTHDISLARIVDRIRKSQAGQGHRGEPGLSDDQIAHRHLDELDTWYAELPPFLRFDASNQRYVYPSHFRQLITLQLRYQHARLLLTRPFYLRLIQTQSSSPPSGQAGAGGEVDADADVDADTATATTCRFGDICIASALDSWRLAQHLWERGQFNDGDIGLDGVFLYQCGMVLSLACLDTRQRCDRKVFYPRAIEDILVMLHDNIPPDNPMSRMVQIADDFCNIVRSIKSEHHQHAAAPLGSHDSTIVQDLHREQQQAVAVSLSQSTPSQAKSARMPRTQENQSRPYEAAAAAAAVSPAAEVDGLPSWTGPPVPACPGGEVGAVDNREEALPLPVTSSAWDMLENSQQLIDSMLDWDLSQVFGFEGGGGGGCGSIMNNNPFLA